MSMKRMVLALFGVASIASLTGCSSLVDGNSEYGCKGMPDSVTCMSVGEVYELTDGDNYKQRVSEVSQQQMAGKEVNVKHQTAGGEVSGPSVSGGAPYVPVPQPTANPQPIRTPSQVMRVLVDPYESSDGDLNVPGYVYTEIEPRRWEVGASRAATVQPVIRPMQAPVSSEPIAENSASTTQAKNTSQNARGGKNQGSNTRTMMPNR
ncbi:type IV conjugative transfer system lipoprotein TraV [Escherichia coli]|uniref:type IV conjugative transfer system lipoprotein TraV n=1 Tax=Escherichia coli TaxID=562 RepID=UPI0011C9D788|nr:type IV conjugative transfer system lipoprotein TraV [Escherichia coli]TXQ48786.1 type IV conjugative transfer system lipoprotein TraV [Escherichia coli]